ncbi:DUF4381 domain-containing protein [Methylobacterium oxalidis]|uniref:DUF4381 domain-containing protein n=1 Tax=Methylobacterium oxalidis TaxID=944322 RepID=A0A512IYW0_9HYPH|nr:DUF4381 domain-containing protein [Methylobacterium oxalidis]GEP02892.1 hypothetical protein MOX02_09300 [Methylobacterium oxalidis]GJE30319.1 hypothetical protein LDDCCGHA_0486 [Methylobacterium oxalidis]GLS65825.1 hypothetical protein GCM10007888_42070 [Methylobacterium oxalidis]
MTDDPGSLANLRDLAVPDPVPFWPLAPGVWIIAVGIAATGAVWLREAVRRRRANAYRRAALTELDAVAASLRPDIRAVEQVSQVMKRAALAAFPREDVAPLTGAGWADFVVETGGGRIDAGALRRPLLDAYGSRIPDVEEIRRFVDQARIWVCDHRTSVRAETP